MKVKLSGQESALEGADWEGGAGQEFIQPSLAREPAACAGVVLWAGKQAK